MKNLFWIAVYLLLVPVSFGQSIQQKLQQAYRQFEADSQLKHAVSSLYVINAKTGEIVFDKNSQVGLAAASTQKIITAATAFELLGKGYRYKTELGYDGKIKENRLDGDLYITGTGDPTLGSWRWSSTKDSFVLQKWSEQIKRLNIKYIDGDIRIDNSKFTFNGIPDGWIWQDIGNYYGAGSYSLNWKENQYDLKLKSGDTVGSQVKVLSPKDKYLNSNELKTASKGTGDNAYIYYNNSIAGTIPISEKSFVISGAIIDPLSELRRDLLFFIWKNIHTNAMRDVYSEKWPGPDGIIKKFYTHYSPTLDSIIYWFLKKSINLYGEALLKTFAYEKKGYGSTDSGVVIIKDFWKQKGLDEDELNLYDGSGLSPLNRITTHAQVEVLKYAKTKDWFPYFYDALPEFNGMKMKSGTISDVKAYCGYQKAKDGNEYIFSFIVNNYNGRNPDLINKMYKVLDNLK